MGRPMDRPLRVRHDQYYLFTTRLTNLGYQRAVMRAIAACSISLSIPASMAVLRPAVTLPPAGPLLYAAIVGVCVALAWPWLRHRWPTRGQSATVVVIGALAMTAGCVMAADPLTGYVTASAWPFILGFAALFHGPGLLAVPVGLAVLTLTVLAVRLAGVENAAMALAMTAPVVMVCTLVVFACRTIATVGGSQEAHDGINPLTGLLTRETFFDRAAALIGARDRVDDRYLVLAVVGIDGLGAIDSFAGERGVIGAQLAISAAVQETVRRDALLGQFDDDDLVIADVFTHDDPSPLMERVRSAIAGTGQGLTASIGALSTPLRPLADYPPFEVLDAGFALAAGAMAQARRGGGNRIDYVRSPDLRLGSEG